MNKSIKYKLRKNNNVNFKISVLIFCYNIENNFYFFLESVLKNLYKNLEIVLLNDYLIDNIL